MCEKRTLRSGFEYDPSITKTTMSKVVHSPKAEDNKRSQDIQEDNARFNESLIELSDEQRTDLAIRTTTAGMSGTPARTHPPTQVTYEQAYMSTTMQYPTRDTRATVFSGPTRYDESRVKIRKFKPGNNVKAWFEIADNVFSARHVRIRQIQRVDIQFERRSI